MIKKDKELAFKGELDTLIKRFRETSSEVMQKQQEFINVATNRDSSMSHSYQDNEALSLQKQKEIQIK